MALQLTFLLSISSFHQSCVSFLFSFWILQCCSSIVSVVKACPFTIAWRLVSLSFWESWTGHILLLLTFVCHIKMEKNDGLSCRDWERGSQVNGKINKGLCVFWGCCNKLPIIELFKTTEIYYFIVLEDRSLKSRCCQDWFFLKGWREKIFYISFLDSGDCWQSLMFLGL